MVLWGKKKKKKKETLFKMEPGRPEGGALTHASGVAACITSKLSWQGRSFFTEEFHLLLSSKRRKILLCPGNNALPTALLFFSSELFFETTLTPVSSQSLVKADFASSDLSVVHHSLHVSNCNSSAILKSTHFASKITSNFIFQIDTNKIINLSL